MKCGIIKFSLRSIYICLTQGETVIGKIQKLISPNIYGSLLIIASGLLAALSNSFIHGMSVKLSVFELVFLKTAVGLMVLSIVYMRSITIITKTRILKFHLIKSIFGVLGNFFWIGALLYLPLAQSASLSLTSALFTSLGGWLLYKERFRWPVFLSLVIGFVGVLIILNPLNTQIDHLIYIVFPLISAMLFSGSSLIIKTISKSDSSLTTLFYLMLFMCLFSAPLALWYWQWPELSDTLRIVLVGLFYILTQMALIEAYTKAETSFIAPFKFARFPLNIFAGMVFFMEIPIFETLFGALLILVSNLLLIRFDRPIKKAKMG